VSQGTDRDTVKVSALVTCFNHERYIKEAVDSVLEQRAAFFFEIVICDDGSSDGTPAILREIQAQHPDRVRLLLSETNLGQGGVGIFMRGVELCRGEYVAVLDGDDYWTEPCKLQRQADFLDARPDCPMCFHNSEVRYEDGSREPWALYPSPLKERLDVEALLEVSSIHNSTLMFRPQVLADYREWCQVMGAEGLNDWAAALVAARRGPLGYLDAVMAVYRQCPAGAWVRLGPAGQLEAVIGRYEAMDRFLGGRYHELIEKAVCTRSYEAAVEFERRGDLESARRHLARCLTGRPEWLDNYVAAHGLKSGEFWEMLSKRMRLYRRPALFRLAILARPLGALIEWLGIKILVMLQTPLRLARGLGLGLIWASPNPAFSSARHPDLAATTVKWISFGTGTPEVRVGTPDGALVAAAAAGAITTGEWVKDGMLFYLQNVSHGRVLTLANTLDVVRVTVRKRKNRTSMARDRDVEPGKTRCPSRGASLNQIKPAEPEARSESPVLSISQKRPATQG
jgi:glycosyltransferase involved in cell wall biosynthesis